MMTGIFEEFTLDCIPMDGFVPTTVHYILSILQKDTNGFYVIFETSKCFLFHKDYGD